MRQKTVFWVQAALFSILGFFSASFVQILFQVAGPLNGYKSEATYDLEIGFPFAFYRQWAGNPYPNCGWQVGYLIVYCLLFWLACTFFYNYFRKIIPIS